MITFRPILLTALMCVLSVGMASSREIYSVHSPDRRTEVILHIGDSLALSVVRRGTMIASVSPLSLTVEGRRLPSSIVQEVRVDSVDTVLRPVVAEKRALVPDVYHQMTVRFAGDWSLVVRLYNDGVAYRYRLAVPGDVTVNDEQLTICLAPGDSIWFPEETGFLSHSERLYKVLGAGSIADTQMCCLPAIVATAAGPRLAIAEADLRDYPGLYLRGDGRGIPALHGLLPRYPAEEEAVGDRTVRVVRRAPYLARTRGTKDFPWRVVGIADADADLLENDIVYRLGAPCALSETSWIRPGKVAWDWWNANNVYGVPFRSGINTDTYTYYIDFAAANGIEYIILDEGWSKPSDLFAVNPAMDLGSLFAHAKKKNVGIILWVLWNALDQRLTEALDRFVEWGAAGIKVDFMQRDDQKMVNYYERVAREAARRHLLVDFHGAFKPTGLNRTYPNVLTREGVHGLENCKWAATVTPRHDVTLPYTRMFAGAMDYTPGAMRNANRENFRPVFEEPMSQGTRCHQLAMYVVYESPLQMLCDNPSAYQQEPAIMAFLGKVPTTWDQTKALNGAIGSYVTVARKKGDLWYIGAMTDWTPRELSLDLSFIGPCVVEAFEDGINAARHASDYSQRTIRVTPGEPLLVRLAPGGGWAAVVRPVTH
jgi:alpha-glucosidase